MLQTNPSMNVLSKGMKLLSNIDSKDKKDLMKKMSNAYSNNVMTSQMSILSPDLQDIMLEESSRTGNLKSINKMFLSASAKSKYNDLMKA